jgi:Short C-terminal domain
MPLSEKRPLKSAAMVGDAGQTATTPATANRVDDAASDANRIDALTKLKALYASGVLTEEQYNSEHARLTEGI